jgi:hypothetical protein
MEVLIEEYEHHSNAYRLVIKLFTNGEQFYYISTIDKNGKLIIKTTSNRMSNIWTFLESFDTRVSDFYSAYGNEDEIR